MKPIIPTLRIGVFLVVVVALLLAGVSASAQTARAQSDNPNGNYNPTYNPNQIALLRWYHGNAAPTVFTVPNNFSGTTTGTEGIAFDGVDMWVASYDTGILNLLSINGAVLDTIYLGGNPLALAYDGANIWVTNRGRGRLQKVSVATHTFTTLDVIPGLTDPYKVAFDGQSVWITSFRDNKVAQLTTGGALVRSFDVGNPTGLAFDGDCIWVASSANSNVQVIAVPGRKCAFGAKVFPSGGQSPFNIVYDGTNMWVTNQNSDNVAELDGVYGAGVLQTIPVGRNPQGLAFDGAYIWVANIFQKTLYKLLASNNPLGFPGTVVAIFQTFPSGAYVGPNELAFDGANMWATLGGKLVGKF